jgi:hypothetical protein
VLPRGFCTMKEIVSETRWFDPDPSVLTDAHGFVPPIASQQGLPLWRTAEVERWLVLNWRLLISAVEARIIAAHRPSYEHSLRAVADIVWKHIGLREEPCNDRVQERLDAEFSDHSLAYCRWWRPKGRRKATSTDPARQCRIARRVHKRVRWWWIYWDLHDQLDDAYRFEHAKISHAIAMNHLRSRMRADARRFSLPGCPRKQQMTV